MPLSPDTLLNERYRIVSVLGQGGNGAVYLAHDLRLAEAPCAIKENLNPSPQAETQFRREATVLAALRHPNLPRVTNHFVLGNQQYLVMDFVEGADLKTRLDQNGPLPEVDVLVWAHQIASALAYMHSRKPPILHRDIKPGNIKINAEGEAVLVDFGLAKAAETGERTATGAVGLTPGFAPPEQYAGGTDERSDVYALGATLYNLLTGQIPTDGLKRLIDDLPLTPLITLRPDISLHVEAVLRQALEVDARQRFPTVAALRDALADTSFRYEPQAEPTVVRTPEPEAPPAPETLRGKPKLRRDRGCLVTCGVLGVILLALVGGAAWFGSDPQRIATVARDPWVGTQVMGAATAIEQSGFTTPLVGLATQFEQAGWGTPVINVVTQVAQSPLGTLVAQASTQLAPTVIIMRVTATFLPEAPATYTQPAAPTVAPSARATPVPLLRTATPSFSPTPRPLGSLTELQTITTESAQGWDEFNVWQTGASQVLFALSPDGQSVALPADQGILLVEAVTGREIKRVFGFANGTEIRGLAHLGDSLLIQWVTNGRSEILQWSIANDNQLRRFGIEGRDLRVSPNRGHFAVRDRYISVFQLDTGALLFNRGDDGSQQEFAFSPDGQYFALENKLNAELYDLRTGQQLRTLIGHGEPTLGLTFSPDSQLLISAGGDVWEVATGARLRTFDSAASQVAVSPNGQVIVGNDGTAYNLNTGELVGLFPNSPDQADRLAFIENPQLMLWQAVGGPIRVWTASPAAARPLKLSTAAAPRPTREAITSLNLPRLARLDEIGNGGYTGLAINTEGTLLLAWQGTTAEVIRFADGQSLTRLETRGTIRDAAFLGNTQAILLLANDAERWDLGRGKAVQTYAISGQRVEASPDGRMFAVQDKYIQIIEAATGKFITDNLGTPDSRQEFLFAPDNATLALAAQNNVVLYTIATQQTRTLSGHGVRVTGLAFTPDGSRLAAANGDVWDLTNRGSKPLATFTSNATRIALNSDGTLVLTSDGSLWDGNTGQYLGTHPLTSNGLWIMPHNQYVLAHRQSNRVELWALRAASARPTPSEPTPVPNREEISPANAANLQLLGWGGSDKVLEFLVSQKTFWEARPLFNSRYRALASAPANGVVAALALNDVQWIAPDSGRTVATYSPFLNPEQIQEVAHVGPDMLVLKDLAGLELWDLTAQELKRRYNVQGTGLVANPTGTHFALRIKDGVQVFEVASGNAVFQRPVRVNVAPQSYLFASDGQTFLAANGAVIQRWAIPSGEALINPRLVSRRASTYGLSLTPDGATLVAASGEIWDVTTGERVREFQTGATVGTLNPKGTVWAGNDGSVWGVATGERVATLFDRRELAKQILFSSDGRYLLWLTATDQLYSWGVPAAGLAALPTPEPNALTASTLTQLQPLTHYGRGRWRNAVWSPKNGWLALNTTGNTLLYNSGTLQLQQAYLSAEVLAFDSEGQALLKDAKGLRLINVQNGAEVRRFEGYAGATAAAFSPNGELLALAGAVRPDGRADGLVVLEIKRNDLEIINQNGRGRYNEPPRLEFTSDSGKLVRSYPNEISIWEIADRGPLTNPITGNTLPAALSTDGRYLAYFKGNRLIVVRLERALGEHFFLSAAGTAFFPGGIDNPNYFPLDYTFLPTGRLLVAYQKTDQRSLRKTLAFVTWDINSTEQRGGNTQRPPDVLTLSDPAGTFAELYQREQPEFGVAIGFESLGERFYTLTPNGVLTVWKYAGTSTTLATSGTDYLDTPRLALSPDGTVAAVPNALNGIELRSLTTGQITQKFDGPWLPTALAFLSPKALLIFEPDESDGKASILDITTEAIIATFTGPRFERFGGLSADGRLLASWARVSGGWTLNINAIASGPALLQLGRFPQPAELAFSPDRIRLAVARGKQVEVWNLHTNQIEFKLARARETGNLIFTPDGQQLIAASGEIWQVSDGTLRTTFDTTGNLITLSPTGDAILGLDGTLWNIASGQPIEQIRGVNPSALSLAFINQGQQVLWQLPGGLLEVWHRP